MTEKAKFCPLINATCRQERCMMWYQGECAYITTKIKKLEQLKRSEERMVDYDLKIPQELEAATPEQLAEIIFEKYIEKKPIKVLTRKTGVCSPMRPTLSYSSPEKYLGLRRLNSFSHPEFYIKVDEAKSIVNKKLCSIWDEKYSEKFEEEKDKIKKISPDVLEWAKSLQLKEIKESDLQVYLVENKLSFLRESTTNLLNLVNLGLKK